MGEDPTGTLGSEGQKDNSAGVENTLACQKQTHRQDRP